MTDPAPLADEELAAIRERAEKATPGPWRTEDPGPYIHSVWGKDDPADVGYAAPVAKMLGRQDARFIAHARTDIPRLIAALRAERAERAKFEEIVWGNECGCVGSAIERQKLD